MCLYISKRNIIGTDTAAVGVLDVDGWKERFNAKNTHASSDVSQTTTRKRMHRKYRKQIWAIQSVPWYLYIIYMKLYCLYNTGDKHTTARYTYARRVLRSSYVRRIGFFHPSVFSLLFVVCFFAEYLLLCSCSACSYALRTCVRA